MYRVRLTIEHEMTFLRDLLHGEKLDFSLHLDTVVGVVQLNQI